MTVVYEKLADAEVILIEDSSLMSHYAYIKSR